MKLTESQIRALVDEPYFSRGKEYCAAGAIKLISVTAYQVMARAQGSRMYRVTLLFENGKLSGRCSCRAFSDLGPCKHIAATGFAVMRSQRGTYSCSWESAIDTEEMAELVAALKKKTKNELIALIVSLSEHDMDLMNEI